MFVTVQIADANTSSDAAPFTYLRDILQRMTEGYPMSRLDELLSWNWSKMRVKH